MAPNRAFLSYGAPLVIWAVMAAVHQGPWTFTRTLLTAMWTLHFSKRLAEARHLHVYSPGKDMHGCFTSKASLFYVVGSFGIGGAVLLDESFAARDRTTPSLLSTIAPVTFLCSVSVNAYCHWRLRLLKTARPPNAPRTFPRGDFFEWVACPHYTAEVATWLSFALVCRTLPAWLFFLATFGLLLRWSQQRHHRYMEMDGYKQLQRDALIPYVW